MRITLLLLALIAMVGCSNDSGDVPDAIASFPSFGSGKLDEDEVLAQLSAAVEANPDDAGAYSRRADELYHRGEFSRAIADYTKALSIKPDAKLYYNRGVQYTSRGQYELAI